MEGDVVDPAFATLAAAEAVTREKSFPFLTGVGGCTAPPGIEAPGERIDDGGGGGANPSMEADDAADDDAMRAKSFPFGLPAVTTVVGAELGALDDAVLPLVKSMAEVAVPAGGPPILAKSFPFDGIVLIFCRSRDYDHVCLPKVGSSLLS